jgi:hypothetical protein
MYYLKQWSVSHENLIVWISFYYPEIKVQTENALLFLKLYCICTSKTYIL